MNNHFHTSINRSVCFWEINKQSITRVYNFFVCIKRHGCVKRSLTRSTWMLSPQYMQPKWSSPDNHARLIELTLNILRFNFITEFFQVYLSCRYYISLMVKLLLYYLFRGRAWEILAHKQKIFLTLCF